MTDKTPFWGPDFNALQAEDPDIAGVVLDELDRLRGGLQLIASENFTSPAVLAALGSTLSNKYADREDTALIDYDEVRDLALQHQPKMIICGATAYPRLIDFEKFRAIADEVGAWLMVDAAHFIGLVAGKAIPSPVPFADVVTFTTHKVLRGPRGGMILCTE